jgi:DNA-binding NarL/FixJ family response regulator
LIGHLPRVRDQIICLGLPNRQENDRIQSWIGSVELLETCVRQIYRLSEVLRPPALLSTIAPFVPHQVSLPYLSSIPLKENTSSSPLPSQKNRPIQLSPRLMEIVRYLAQGKSNKEIATALGTSVRTVDHQREAIMLKLDLHSLTELIHYAVRNGLITL